MFLYSSLPCDFKNVTKFDISHFHIFVYIFNTKYARTKYEHAGEREVSSAHTKYDYL